MESVKQLLILILLWIVILLGHYYLVPGFKIPWVIAFTDPFVHGLIAFTLFLPFRFRNKISTQLLLLLTLSAILIDIDHAIVAKSISPKAMVSLLVRPISHSIAFSIVFGLLCSLIHYLRYRNRKIVLFIFYLFSLSLISHVMRDSIDSQNTPWAFPFHSFPVSEIFFFTTFFILTMLHLIDRKKVFE